MSLPICRACGLPITIEQGGATFTASCDIYCVEAQGADSERSAVVAHRMMQSLTLSKKMYLLQKDIFYSAGAKRATA